MVACAYVLKGLLKTFEHQKRLGRWKKESHQVYTNMKSKPAAGSLLNMEKGSRSHTHALTLWERVIPGGLDEGILAP